MFLGIDIGSSSSKVAVMDERKQLISVAVVNMGTGTGGVEEARVRALEEAGIAESDVEFTIVTGYGRVMYKEADRQITEITCHARGVDYLVRGARTVIDIGGQDAKVIKLDGEGRVSNFVMNEKCAAGTGRFLEVMARVLGCRLDELSGLARQSTKEISINNVCTVFAESEVISRLSTGEAIPNVARGAHVAIAKRVMGMCSRVGYEPDVIMTGGVALNEDMVDAMARELQMPVAAAPHPQAVGAIGAAVLAYETVMKHREKEK